MGSNWSLIQTGGTLQVVNGSHGIDSSTVNGVVTLKVDLADTDAGLEFTSGDTDAKLKAAVATNTNLGSVKIGSGVDVSADGTISVTPAVTSVDLGYTVDGDNDGTVTNTAGNDATIPIATDTEAGLFTGAEKSKLEGIEDNATNAETNDLAYVKKVGDASTQTVSGTGGVAVEGLFNVGGDLTIEGITDAVGLGTDANGKVIAKSAGAAPGDGTITIKQPGTTDQTFTVNQSGNTEINLKNDNTVVTPGNGGLSITTAGEGHQLPGPLLPTKAATQLLHCRQSVIRICLASRPSHQLQGMER